MPTTSGIRHHPDLGFIVEYSLVDFYWVVVLKPNGRTCVFLHVAANEIIQCMEPDGVDRDNPDLPLGRISLPPDLVQDSTIPRKQLLAALVVERSILGDL